MALTIIEAANLSQSMMLQGVVETMTTTSPVLKYLPFMTINGSSLQYNQVLTHGTVEFHAVGDVWVESTPTFARKQASLAILGGDADVDNFLQQTYANINDLEATVIEAKARAVGYKFATNFINGDVDVDSNAFDGLAKLAAVGQTATVGPNGGALTLDLLDALLDQVRPGKPDLLLMSRRSRRSLTRLARTTGTVASSPDEFGISQSYYNGIPIEVDDNIGDAEVVGSSNDCSSIYALQFGYERGVMGLDNGGIQVERLGPLEAKDASRTRLKWYVGLANFRDAALARLKGVR